MFSNSLNEALFWERNVISFGELIDDPINRLIPSEVAGITSAKSEKYMARLYRNTWYLSDFTDPNIVDAILVEGGALDRVSTYSLVYDQSSRTS